MNPGTTTGFVPETGEPGFEPGQQSRQSRLNLKVDRDPLGGVTFIGSADAGAVNVMTSRQREDFQIGLLLLEAACRPDEAFFSDDPLDRMLEVAGAREIAAAVAAAENQSSEITIERQA